MSRTTIRCRRCDRPVVEVRSTSIGERRVTFLTPDTVIRTLKTPKRLSVACGHCGTQYLMNHARLVIYLEADDADTERDDAASEPAA